MAFQSSNKGSSANPEPFSWMVGLALTLAALMLALPALVLGLLLGRAFRQQSWSMLLWLALTLAGAVLLVVLSTHGLSQLILAQVGEIVQSIKQYHANLARWNPGRLWSETWPVWLRTVALTPMVALWRELETRKPGSGAAFLTRQEHERQEAVSRAKKRAIRRARNPRRIPEAVDGQMVIGVSIEDEHAQ